MYLRHRSVDFQNPTVYDLNDPDLDILKRILKYLTLPSSRNRKTGNREIGNEPHLILSDNNNKIYSLEE